MNMDHERESQVAPPVRSSEISDLIARLENATGSDRRLDAAIWESVDQKAFAVAYSYRRAMSNRDWTPEEQHKQAHDLARRLSPAFTASIDAAITLVPEGFAWKIGTCCVSDDAWVVPDYNSLIHGDRLRKEIGEPVHGGIWDNGIDVDQRPPGRVAIALCIAALRARIAMTAPQEEPDPISREKTS